MSEDCTINGVFNNVTFDCVLSFLISLITACKRSMGQGNIFTRMCHSVHGGGAFVVAWGWGGGAFVVAGGHAWLPGGHAWLGGCMVAMDMCGCWGACMVDGGAWLPWTCVVAGGMYGWWRCMVVGGVHGWWGGCVGYNEIRSMSGRYASYWNAFLLNIFSPY